MKRWKKNQEEVLEIIESIRFRTDIEAPIAYVDRILKNSLQEKDLNFDITEELLIEDNRFKNVANITQIIMSVVEKYSNSTGTIATFLVKDTFINAALEVTSLQVAKQAWKNYEETIMKSIYKHIKKNQYKKLQKR
ncbi:hypothetical protein BN2127_JRS10_03279 [Bacillus subtilis]|nr:hypothetical protein BN2127_JRS10_03279 [Bacillus subtilis]